jgi:hypothetical protein
MGGVGYIGSMMTATAALIAIAPSNAVNAEPEPPSLSSPLPVPTIVDPHYFALPYAAPTYNFGKLDIDKFRREAPPIAFDSVDLGKSILRFDLVDNTMTRPDTPDLSDVIVPLRPGKKRSTPRYFGLTLVTPTH